MWELTLSGVNVSKTHVFYRKHLQFTEKCSGLQERSGVIGISQSNELTSAENIVYISCILRYNALLEPSQSHK